LSELNLIVGDIVAMSTVADGGGVSGGVESISEDRGKKTKRKL